MQTKKTGKTLGLALGGVMAASMAGAALAVEAGNPFELTELTYGYMADAMVAQGSCGEGKCGEGKCGEADGDKGSEGSCGEGKCGEGKCGSA